MSIIDLYYLFIHNPQITTDSRICPKGSIFFLRAGGPDAAADLKAVYVREHDVQQRHANVVVFREQAQRLLARGRLYRLVARAPEIYDDKAADAGFVLEDQYLFDVVHAPFVSSLPLKNLAGQIIRSWPEEYMPLMVRDLEE